MSLKGNVILGENLSKRMTEVLGYVADSVATTLGPNGHNTIIQNMDRLFSTKDGWTVLQNIQLHNTVGNSIKSMIESVAQSTVLRAGDGSTTATVAANALNKIILELTKNGEYTIRDIEDTMEKCVDDIIDVIRSKATVITDENLGKEMYDIAMVSTNWNEELSKMISDIYTTTHNPIIKIGTSGTDKTNVKYIDGYELAGRLVSPDMYINDTDKGACVIKNPAVLLFDFSLNEKWVSPLLLVSNIIAAKKNQTVVVMAPGFNDGFRNKLLAYNKNQIRNNQAPANFVPATYVNNYAIDRECVDDFMTLLGTVPITITNDEVKECFDDLYSIMNDKPITGENGETKVIGQEEKENAMIAAMTFVDQYTGTCGQITISKNDSIIVQDLFNNNTTEVAKRIENLSREIRNKTNECDALTMITDDIRVKRIRLGKIQRKMGTIEVGGYSDANLRAKKDALDDATRACEAAYRSGYVKGSSLTIIESCMELLSREHIKDVVDDDSDILWVRIFRAICVAYVEVFKTLIKNKYPSFEDDKIYEIIDNCKSNNQAYDVVSEAYVDSKTIITPTDVDVESVKACLRLVLITATSAQMLIKSYDGYEDPDVATSITPILQ